MKQAPEDHPVVEDVTAEFEARRNAHSSGNGQNGPTEQQNPIKLLPYGQMVNLPPVDWLVNFVVPKRAKSVLFGQSDSYKSFLAIDLGCSVSTGRSFHGNMTTQCKVIYVANEGAIGVGRKRIPAWMAYHEIPDHERENIFLVTVETTLPNETSRNNLIAAIRTVVSPGEDFFLVIDVLRGTMNGSESDDEAAFAWTAAAEILISEGASILAVTHSPYGEDGRMRGHSHLWGSFDTRLHAEGDKEKRSAVLKVNRHKDHDSSGQWGFHLEEHAIEEHEGETSLVPRLDGDVKPKKGKAKNGTATEIVFQALQDAVDRFGELPPLDDDSVRVGRRCVAIDKWRELAERQPIAKTDNKDSVQAAFRRAQQTLIANNRVKTNGAWAWIVKV